MIPRGKWFSDVDNAIAYITQEIHLTDRNLRQIKSVTEDFIQVEFVENAAPIDYLLATHKKIYRGRGAPSVFRNSEVKIHTLRVQSEHRVFDITEPFVVQDAMELFRELMEIQPFYNTNQLTIATAILVASYMKAGSYFGIH